MLKNIVFTVFQTLRRQGISSWRCYKTSVFCWAPGGGPGQDCLAGVRLSGVSLSGRRPRASPCPCRRPSVGNRRTDSVSTDVPVIYGVFCLRCLKKNLVFFTVFRALRRQGISSWRCYKTSVFTWFWAPGGGPGRKNWHVKIVSS